MFNLFVESFAEGVDRGSYRRTTDKPTSGDYHGQTRQTARQFGGCVKEEGCWPSALVAAAASGTHLETKMETASLSQDRLKQQRGTLCDLLSEYTWLR